MKTTSPKLPILLLIVLTNCAFNFETGWAQAPLSLQEALQIAKQNNLQLRQQSQNEKVAELEEWVQTANRLPSLDMAITSSYFSEVNEIDLSGPIGIPGRSVQLGGHDRSEISVGIQQPIFTGFRLQSQVDLAKNSTLSERAKLDVLSNEVYHQVHALFYQTQSLYTQRKILQASLKRLNVQLRHVRNLFEAAQAMAFDTLQVHNQKLAVNIELENNGLQIRLAELQMARILDLPKPRPISETDLDEPAAELVNLEQLEQRAVGNRPELESIRIAQDGALIQQKLARSTFFPSIFGQASFHYAKPGLDPVANEWMDYISAGVNLQWNLWRWRGDETKVEEFEVVYNRLELEEREQLRTIDYEVEQSVEELNHSIREWQLAMELRDQQSERFRIVSVQHQNGVASTNDLITAEADLTQAELQKEQALVRYYLNLANLRKATGTIAEGVE